MLDNYDGRCEDIWMEKDSSKAIFVLETYSNYISDYGLSLLCEVIFGIDSKPQYTNLKRDSLESFSFALTKYFDKADFYQPKSGFPERNKALEFISNHIHDNTPWEGL